MANHARFRRIGEGDAMCMAMTENLTLANLLSDPLTHLVMRSDGVSEEEFSTLWERLRQVVSPPSELSCAAAT